MRRHAASASNMALLGHQRPAGPQRLPAGDPEQNGRWIAYVGHHGGRA